MAVYISLRSFNPPLTASSHCENQGKLSYRRSWPGMVRGIVSPQCSLPGNHARISTSAP